MKNVMNSLNSFPSAPFIIAEMSGNHNSSLERAIKIIEAAANSGAHALKLQTYTADSMTIDVENEDFIITDKGSLWKGESLYNLYKKASTPYEWHLSLFNHIKSLGMKVISTPFDAYAVDFLESIGCEVYKIASFEITDLSLIYKVALTKKPVIISTGMATISEISDAVITARNAGCTDLTLLKCTSNYPANPEGSNLKTIPHMRELFQCNVGLSDHTLGIGVSLAAVALGASVIERHFTLRRADGGVDSDFSLEPHEFSQLIVESERAYQGLGSINYGVTEQERPSLKFRRSLYIVEDLKSGDILNHLNLRAIRPGHGLSPKYLDIFVGRKVARDIKRGTPLSWDLLD